jgi:hypothetical protein
MYKISHGDVQVSGERNITDRIAKFIPNGNWIAASGTTDAEALRALASKMRRIAEEIEAIHT